MTDNTQANALLDFLRQHVIRSKGLEITENTSLVTSGLVDSLTLPQLLNQLENVTGLRIPSGRVSPQDFETVIAMLSAAQRVGQPKPK
jgi:acyl carrier protein